MIKYFTKNPQVVHMNQNLNVQNHPKIVLHQETHVPSQDTSPMK